MTISLSIPSEDFELKPRITVIGVGGAGGNAVNNMIEANLEGVEFIVANTDAQAISNSKCENRIQLGVNVTRGLGAGSRPEVGQAAAEEALQEVMEYLHGSNMVFVTAGMGGGTGTGAAPVIAKAARDAGILTVGVVTKPFHFEGAHRMRKAEAGLQELQQVVDTLIIIPNQNLFRIANEKTTFADAFNMADDVLHSGVRGITDLMVMPGLVNLDFADIRTVMMEMGKAMMGTGEAEGEGRAVASAEAAISNPLLDDVSMKGAQGVLINITGGMDMTLFEIDEAANRIREEVDNEANIIFGSTFDQDLEGVMRVSIVATGIDGTGLQREESQPITQQAIGQAGAGGYQPGSYGQQGGGFGTPPVQGGAGGQANFNAFGMPIRPTIRQTQAPQPAVQRPAPQPQQASNMAGNDGGTGDQAPEASTQPAANIAASSNASNNADVFVPPVPAEVPADSLSETIPQSGPVMGDTDVLPKQVITKTSQTVKTEPNREPGRSSFLHRFKNTPTTEVKEQAPEPSQDAATVPGKVPALQAAGSSKSTTQSEASAKPPHTNNNEPADDLEIPAFLRRKKN